jgi:hypothetical protein
MGNACCQKGKNELSRGKENNFDKSKTYTPNLKNFKNLKLVNNIHDFYTFESQLG